jgi:hypothetical protein
LIRQEIREKAANCVRANTDIPTRIARHAVIFAQATRERNASYAHLKPTIAEFVRLRYSAGLGTMAELGAEMPGIFLKLDPSQLDLHPRRERFARQ